MVHTCLEKFPFLAEEKFLLQEVAWMFKKEVNQLQRDATVILNKLERMNKGTKHEVSSWSDVSKRS